MSPQFAVDVSLLLSAAAHPVVQDLLDANKLVRDMRRSAAQTLHFSVSFAATGFWFWVDPSDRLRPDDSRTGSYVITLQQKTCSGKVKKTMSA